MSDANKLKLSGFLLLISIVVFLYLKNSNNTGSNSVAKYATSNFQVIEQSLSYREVNMKLKNISGKRYNGDATIKIFFKDGTSTTASGNLLGFDAGDVQNVRFGFNVQDTGVKWEWYAFDQW